MRAARDLDRHLNAHESAYLTGVSREPLNRLPPPCSLPLRLKGLATREMTPWRAKNEVNAATGLALLTNELPLSCSLSCRLTVHYPPILTLNSMRERVLEGDSVRFRCAAESSAGDGEATRFTWFVGGRRVRIDRDAADSVSEFTLESADRRLNGHAVKCEAENAVGRSDVSMLLDVSCECSYTAYSMRG